MLHAPPITAAPMGGCAAVNGPVTHPSEEARQLFLVSLSPSRRQQLVRAGFPTELASHSLAEELHTLGGRLSTGLAGWGLRPHRVHITVKDIEIWRETMSRQ